MIEVKNLTKKYGGNTVVNHISFTIEPGKIYGFLGPNGAGKSTTMNMITGCLAPTDGQVLINGKDVYEDAKAAKKAIGYLPEIPPLYPDMTPLEYLTFVAKAKGIKPSQVDEEVFNAMEETNITDMRNRLIKNLSKGYKQRVGIAMSMLGDPEIIILDEPTVGLDPRQVIEIRDLISRLGETRTIILSSHILTEVSAVCDHVMIINHGNLVASDTLDNIRKDNTPENRIEMTVRSNPDAIDSILRSVEGIVSYNIEKTSDSNVYNVEIDVAKEYDVSEELSRAFISANYGVLRLTKSEPSLEEIFLKLTEAELPGEEDEEEQPEANDEEAEDKQEDAETDEKSDEDDDYVPLFGRKDE
ncbi:MAG: ATP-binding cassette domain-containing protein [Firmicutes bacterium]|nr:ATP-binding cassette domain-containing protein [Candidatus Colimorpha enterica]